MKECTGNTLGEKLRIAREYLDLTQEQVAKILNIGRDAVLRIESGNRKISTDELVNFSKLYRINIDDLLNESKEIDYKEQAFARGFEKLSEKDKKEILDLIKLKNELKNKGE